MFLKGLIFGLCLAAPLGPIGLLCIQRTLNRGRLYGFVSGLGVAAADAFYASLAAFGLSAVTSFLLGIQTALQLIGGIVLIGLAIKIAFASPSNRAAKGDSEPGLWHAWFSILLLTFANPATILSFLAAFAGLGLAAGTGTFTGALRLVVGVFLGSAAWWLLLSFIAGSVRAHLSDGRMRVVNLFAGLLVGAFGLWVLAPVIQKWWH
jgi:threonine/homoserine/homoserine lactone efflux protein